MPALQRRTSVARHRIAAGVLAGALAVVLVACSNSTGESTAAPPVSGGGGGGSTVPANLSENVPLSDVPGVTDDSITYSAFGTQANNPLGTCVLDCYTDGINAYFAYRNSEGGIYGRQLKLAEPLDDELANNQARALEITSADDTFGAFSATQVPTGWGTIADAGIPLYTWSIHPTEMEGREGVFGYTGVLCTRCTNRAIVYSGTLVGATKVGTLGYGVSPNSQECAQAAADGVNKYSSETGMTAVYTNDQLAFGLPNGIGPEVTAMKDAGVDYIIGCLDLNGMKTLAQELERQGMGDTPMYHPNTYDAAFVAQAGGLFDGDIVGVQFRPFESASEGSLATYQKWMEETGSEITEISMVGWLNADLAYQGLVAAGPEFSREKVIAATNQMTAYTGDGLIPPIDWTRQHNAPTEEDPATHGSAKVCAAYVKVVDGKFQLVGDANKPFYCWDGSTSDWAEPTQEDLADS